MSSQGEINMPWNKDPIGILFLILGVVAWVIAIVLTLGVGHSMIHVVEVLGVVGLFSILAGGIIMA